MDLQFLIEGRCFTLFSIETGESTTDFLMDLKRDDIDEYDRINRRIEQLAERGPTRRRNEFNTLGPELYEAKSKGGARVVFFYDKNRIVICACGFGKKARKTPKQILKTARTRKDAYENQKKLGKGFNILVPEDMVPPRRMP
jgi:phage-related protein